MTNAQQLVRAAAAHREEEQKATYDFFYRQTVVVPNGGSETAVLQISNDADFDCQMIAGSLLGPVDANGVPIATAIGPRTDFPYPGLAAGADPIARSGVMLKITDQGRDLPLTNDFVFAETILTPGYSPVRYDLQKFVYLFQKNSVIRLECRNRDTATTGVGGAQQYHQLTVTFYGRKIR